jgi:hypothetical protein
MPLPNARGAVALLLRQRADGHAVGRDQGIAEHADDAEGELLARVRDLIGDNMPLVASLDLHANVTRRMLSIADALVAYRTYPHIDMAETGERAAELLQRRLRLGRREALAVQNGYHASAQFADDGRQIKLRLEASTGASLPDTLQLRVVHPTRAGRDGLVMLRKTADGLYSGVGPALTEGRWMLILQDQQSTWRLDGAMVAPHTGAVSLAPASSK